MKKAIFFQGLRNIFFKRPLALSLEVTHSCTCSCLHCDKGGAEGEEKRIGDVEYQRLVLELKPLVVQISGGEPLVRSDVEDVIRAVKGALNNGLPLLIFVTNGSLFTEEKYISLKRAGVDRFSISLDFPDERHDEFRRHPGLYRHLSELIPYLAKRFGGEDIALNSCITGRNFTHILQLYEKASEWGVSISYSAYSVLRTGNENYFIKDKKDLAELKRGIERLIELKRKGECKILNPISNLYNTYRFFKNGVIEKCRAGMRFLVVRPDGTLNPCSMHPGRQYKTQKEMLKGFTKGNDCGACYVAIRAYTDKSFFSLIRDNISFIM
jgi:MoaA/NifB/PqqE/SkfB family radical SAM enzyme